MNQAEQFFFENAGYSQDPKFETQAEAQIRCARELAAAEMEACVKGYSFEWMEEGETTAKWAGKKERPIAFRCLCRDPAGYVVESLGGTDFLNNDVWQSPYRRVVEAELALEALKQKNS
jgi:hypothetical protein